LEQLEFFAGAYSDLPKSYGTRTHLQANKIELNFAGELCHGSPAFYFATRAAHHARHVACDSGNHRQSQWIAPELAI
jgi:hypothetical protein